MLDGYISDLEAGDVFEPVEHVLMACRRSAALSGRCRPWPSAQRETVLTTSLTTLARGGFAFCG
jgi:hypothetical protein